MKFRDCRRHFPGSCQRRFPDTGKADGAAEGRNDRAASEYQLKRKDVVATQRILLKLSGEALAGEKKTGFDEETVRKVALQVGQLTKKGIQVGIVIGGGNFWRGRTSEHIDRVKAEDRKSVV